MNLHLSGKIYLIPIYQPEISEVKIKCKQVLLLKMDQRIGKYYNNLMGLLILVYQDVGYMWSQLLIQLFMQGW